MTELVDKLITYAAGQIGDSEAQEIEALLAQYVDRDLDPDLALQVEQAIEKDQRFAAIVAQARVGKHWFEETLSPELQPILNAPASPGLQRFVESLTAHQQPDEDTISVFPRRTTLRLSDHRRLAVAASIAIVLLASGWGLYGTVEGRLDEARIAQTRLEQELEHRSIDRAQQASRIAELENRIRSQLSDLESSVVARETAQRQLAEARTALKTQRAERSDLDTRLTQIQTEVSKAAEHERQNVDLRVALDEAQSLLDREGTLAANQQQTIETLEEKLVKSVLVIEAMSNETSGLNKHVAELEQTTQTQAAVFEEHQRQLADMTQRSAELQAELDGAIQQVIRLKADREALQVALQKRQPESGDDWTIQVAEYHGLYARQAPRHLVDVPANESAHIEEWLGEQLGGNIAIPDLSDSGIEFKGARLLAIGGMPVAQLMYLDGNGVPLAICLMRNMMGKAKNAELSEHNDLRLVDWRDRAYQYVIVGSTTFETLEALAGRLIES
ncbi:MAG: hypothetical protein ACR2QJ_05490 [Geminicoccaceae bacterium]